MDPEGAGQGGRRGRANHAYFGKARAAAVARVELLGRKRASEAYGPSGSWLVLRPPPRRQVSPRAFGSDMELEESGMREECGVFGCIASGEWPTQLDVPHVITLGLVGLQHR